MTNKNFAPACLRLSNVLEQHFDAAIKVLG